MTQTAEFDPVAAAMNAKPSNRIVYGECQVDYWPAVWHKEEGATKATLIPFDAGLHDVGARLVRMEFTIIPVRGQYNLERKMVDKSSEWIKITLPSLKALGFDIRSINGRYVKVELVPTGRTGSRTNSDGTTVTTEFTALKFLAVYDNPEDCERESQFAYASSNGFSQVPAEPAAPVAPAQPAGPQMTRDKAATFLSPLLKAMGNDRDKFLRAISAQTALSEHFGPDSPEVIALLSA